MIWVLWWLYPPVCEVMMTSAPNVWSLGVLAAQIRRLIFWIEDVGPITSLVCLRRCRELWVVKYTWLWLSWCHLRLSLVFVTASSVMRDIFISRARYECLLFLIAYWLESRALRIVSLRIIILWRLILISIAVIPVTPWRDIIDLLEFRAFHGRLLLRWARLRLSLTMHHVARGLGITRVIEATRSGSHPSMRCISLAHVARMVPGRALIILRSHRAFVIVMWHVGRITRGGRRHHLMRKCGTVINRRCVWSVSRRRSYWHHLESRTMMMEWRRMGWTMRVVTEVGRPLCMIYWPWGFIIKMHRVRSNFLWPVKLCWILNIVFNTWLKFSLLWRSLVPRWQTLLLLISLVNVNVIVYDIFKVDCSSGSFILTRPLPALPTDHTLSWLSLWAWSHMR